MDILSIAHTLEPNVALFKGDLKQIAKIHISFYKFYIDIALKCEAWVLDKKSHDYLLICIDYLENKKISKKGVDQSRNNCLKMLDSLDELCIRLNCDKNMLVGIRKLIEQATVDDGGKSEDTLDLLKQLQNLLNAPGDTNDDGDEDAKKRPCERPNSPESTGSSAPQEESSGSRGGVESMEKYLLSDSGMDSYYHKYNKDIKNLALTSQMNQIISSAQGLRENTYCGLDNLLAKMKINVPIWNYHVDRVDTIDSSNVMQNMEIFGGNKSVTDAVLYSCPDYLTVGPFDVYVRNKVYVYHCLVNNCNNCMTTSLEFLKLHVKFQHGDSDFDWNCTECDLIKLHSTCQKSLDGALDHLAKHHSIKSTYTLAKERLLEINKKIIADEPYNICPLPKSETNLEDITDLFHCPKPECGFSTNSMSVAFGHYASTLVGDVTVNCRYCPLISYSTYELCEHLVKEHGNASFKCGYCPYRSVSKANCVYHQCDTHSDSPSKIISFEPLSTAEHKYSCRAHNTIKPFVCHSTCNFGTMVESKFNQHILTHPGMMVTCHYCERFYTDDMGDLRDHFLVHGVGEYHCMYCKEAFNFITKTQQHLHEHHPSQYPFMIICQDFDSRSLSLKGKYNKVQKLELGDESVVVLSLESDKSVDTANVIPQSASILIEDVDHCKMQLKTFMKNKEEPVEIPYFQPFPHIEETLDLTTSDDPRERVDIKPRLRVRTIEELMKSAHAPIETPEQPQEPAAVATFYSFSEPMDTGPGSKPGVSTSMLTPAQIKQERVCSIADNEDMSEIDIETHPIGSSDSSALSIQIKNEVLDTIRHQIHAVPKPQPKSPKKKSKQAVNPVHVKMESREMDVDIPSPQPLVIDEGREVRDAVETLILQEGGSSISEGEVGNTAAANMIYESGSTLSTITAAEGTESTSLRPPAGSEAHRDIQIHSTAGASSTVGPAIVLSHTSQSSNAPILNAASIDNIPVDFDCALPVDDSNQDTKQFTLDTEGNMVPLTRYANPTVVDTVIISSEGEDDYEDVRCSPVSSSSGSRPTTPSSNVNQTRHSPKVLTSTPTASAAGSSMASPADAPIATPGSPPVKLSGFTIVPNLVKIFPAPQKMITSSQSTQKSVVLVDTKPTIPVGRIQIGKHPAVQPPNGEPKRFRCKLCNFASEERLVTYNHLTTAHPNRFSKPNQGVPAAKAADSFILAVSCPYCPDIAYEGIKSFEKHHTEKHCDFSEVKCFLVYNTSFKAIHYSQIFACSFCGHFCRNEAAVWQHVYAVHSARLVNLKKPLTLKCTVALKKMVCPLYNCLDEFLDPTAFRNHVNSHPKVVACKKCTYIADSIEEFQKFHMKIDIEDRLLHFSYTQSVDERANLLNVQRFSNPLYSLSGVFFKEKPGAALAASSATMAKKTTARKSTGGAQNK